MDNLEEIKTKLEELSQQADKDGKRYVSRMLHIAAAKVEQAARHTEREVNRDTKKSQAQAPT